MPDAGDLVGAADLVGADRPGAVALRLLRGIHQQLGFGAAREGQRAEDRDRDTESSARLAHATALAHGSCGTAAPVCQILQITVHPGHRQAYPPRPQNRSRSEEHTSELQSLMRISY